MCEGAKQSRSHTLKWHNGLSHFSHKRAGGGGKYKVWQIYPYLVDGFGGIR